MATMAPAVTSKSEQATALRAEAAVLEKELSKLRADLAPAQRKLGELQDRRKKMEQDAAHGQQPKPGTIASLLTEIAEAQLPVDGLTLVVAEKQARLDTVRTTLEALNRDMAMEEQRAAQQARLDAVVKQGAESARELTAAVTECITKLNAYEAIRRQLGDFVDAGTLPNLRPAQGDDGQRAIQARAALAAMHSELFDGAVLRVVRSMRREGWTEGDPVIVLAPMLPPK